MQTSNRLYTEADTVDFVEHLTQLKSEAAQPQQPVVDVSEPVIPAEHLNKLAREAMSKSLKAVRFTVGKKGDKRLMFDNLQIAPNAKTNLSKSFTTTYYEQLNSILFTTDDEINFMQVMGLLTVYDHAVASNGKVALTSARYVSKMKQITDTLTRFFNDNLQVISSVATMMNNRLEKPV